MRNDSININGKLEWKWLWPSFKVPSQLLIGGIEEKHQKHPSGYVIYI